MIGSGAPNVPRGEIVTALPLAAGALGAIPFGAPYVQWATSGLCRELSGTTFDITLQAAMDVVIVAAIGTVPFLCVLWPARWLRGGRTVTTAFMPLIAAFGAHVCLLYPAAMNPLSTFLIDRAGTRSPLTLLFAGLFVVMLMAGVGVAPVWMTLSVRADTTAARFEAQLASCGLWLVVAATLARFFRAAQHFPMGLAAPAVLGCGMVTTLFALTRRRATTAASREEGPYREPSRDANHSAPAPRRRIATVLAVELALLVAWAPALADSVVRPCP